MNNKYSIKNWLRIFLLLVFLYSPLINSFSDALAQTQDSSKQELKDADAKFRNTMFEVGINLLKLGLSHKDAKKEDRVQAYMLMGKIYVALENPARAKLAFGQMLQLDREIALYPSQETPEVIRVFDEVKTAFEEELRWKTEPQHAKKWVKKWPWIVGASFAGGVAAILILGGDGGGNGKSTLVITVQDPSN